LSGIPEKILLYRRAKTLRLRGRDARGFRHLREFQGLGEKGMIDGKYRAAIPLLAESVPLIGKTGVRITHLQDRYARIVMPLGPNVNHIGIMYGGSLFILAELSGGVIYYVSFDHERFYPIIKESSIRYRRPAVTDVTLEVRLGEDEARAIQEAAEKEGKKDWTMDLELKDEDGEVVSIVRGTWQLRKNPVQNQ
jgi:thioesterase domain-containing protein